MTASIELEGYKTKKISKACDECRRRKVKCDGHSTCTKCSERGIDCTYSYVYKKRKSRSIQIERPKGKRGRPKKLNNLSNNINNDNTNNNNNNKSINNNNNSSNSNNNNDKNTIESRITLNNKNITNSPSNFNFSQSPYTENNILRCDSPLYSSTTLLPNQNKSPDDIGVEGRLSKMESMLSLLIHEFANKSTSGNNSVVSTVSATSATQDFLPINHSKTTLLNDAENEEFNTLSESKEDLAIQKWNGLFMHTSIFFLSKIGLIVLEHRMEKPEFLIPLKSFLIYSNPAENNVLSPWISPIVEDQLTPLPSRENIDILLLHLESSTFISKTINFIHLKRLLKLYCDRRDGLINEPNFTHFDYFFMNVCLLISCLIVNELLNIQIDDYNVPMPNFESISHTEENLLNNSLFFYHKSSIISGDILTVSSSLLLAFYADYVSLSRAAYLISSIAIRQAQEIGLHIEDTYRGLEEYERSLKLNIWWACYVLDKEMCVRWGQAPVINDKDVSAPPLTGFESFWSPNNLDSPNTRSNRSLYTYEIQASSESLLDSVPKLLILEQYLITDYAFITSQVYDNFLRANAMKNLSKKEAELLKDKTFYELDCWRLSIPEEIRPRVDYDEKFFDYIEDLKTKNTKLSIYKLILATAFYVKYHHVKLVVHRAYAKQCVTKYSETLTVDHTIEPAISARCILKMSCAIDSRFGNYANYFVFYPFNAFLSICGLYIFLDKPNEFVQPDLQLLLDCLKSHVIPFTINDRRGTRGRLFDYVLKSICYATYKTCVNRFGPIPLKDIEILDEIKEINEGKKTVDDVLASLSCFSTDTMKVKKTFSRLPYFPKNSTSKGVSSQSPNNDNPIHNFNTNNNKYAALVNNDFNRMPNVSFLLSSQHQTNSNLNSNSNPNINNVNNVGRSNFDGFDDHFGNNDGLFQNMLNIPNYFIDYMYDEHPTSSQ
jgi:hypothetical protein